MLAESGRTRVLCTVSIQDQVPQWMYGKHQGGWLTAEYSMLPGASQPRKTRDGRTGRPIDGRSYEIQRLVGRALRAVTDCVVAVAGRDQVDRDRLAELATPRHREDIPDR